MHIPEPLVVTKDTGYSKNPWQFIKCYNFLLQNDVVASVEVDDESKTYSFKLNKAPEHYKETITSYIESQLSGYTQVSGF